MENKHEIEQHFFKKLRELYTFLPDGRVSSPEPPDFLIETDNENIAVEITQIHNEKAENEKFPPAQKHAVEDKILERAKTLFSFRNKVPLHISFYFADKILLNEKQLESLSVEICKLVESEIVGRGFNNHFSFYLKENLPQELVYVSGHFFHNVKEANWYSIKSKFLPKLTKREILSVIKKKEEKISSYLDKAERAILVIVEGVIPNSWFDDIETFEQNELVSQFDKIFIIRNLNNQLIELK